MTSDADLLSTEVAGDCHTANRPYLVGVHMEKKEAILFRPRCKLWSCPYCAEINKNLWAVRAYHGALQYMQSELEIDFLTLTSHERLNAEQSLWVFPRAWKKLSQRARRSAALFSYFMIPERHDDGRVHIHAIETGALGKEWWIDNARECGLGYKQEETPIRKPQGAASYAVKYLSKSMEIADWPPNFRRVRTSRSWPPLPPLESPEGWVFSTIGASTPLSEIVALYTRRGYDLQMLGSAEAWAYIDPDPPT